MAQVKISELNEDTVPTANDVMPVTDAETNTTKKVKLSNLPISNATQSALDTTNSNLSSLSATVATNDSNAVHKTGNETISGIKIISGEVNGNLKVNTPQGHMLNGKIVTSVSTYGTGNYQWSLPFIYYAGVNLIQLQAGSGIFYSGSSFPLTPHNNYYYPGNGVSWTSTKDTITGEICSGTNPVAWASGSYFGLGWQYDI